jgi:hypothetical protein
VWGRDPGGNAPVRTVAQPQHLRTLLGVLAERRRTYRDAWDRLIAEAHAGIRTTHGVDRENYQRLIAFDGEGDAAPPRISERPYGDAVHPYCPVDPERVINDAARAVGGDTAAWTWTRVVKMAASIRAERRARADG